MGADLYNERFNNQDAEYQNRRKAFDDFNKKREGRKNVQLTEEERKEYIELMDKVYDHPYYFRESYGGDGLLSALDLSWWQDVGAIIDECAEKYTAGMTEEQVEAWYETQDINIDAEGCQKFIDLLESRKHMLDAPDYDYVEKGTDWFTGEKYETHGGTWYRERHAKLIEFLTIAKEHGGFSASI